MPESSPRADRAPAPEADPDADGESGPRDCSALPAATADAEAVSDRLRTLAALAGPLSLLPTLIALEPLVRICPLSRRTGTEREIRPIRRRIRPPPGFHFRFRARF